MENLINFIEFDDETVICISYAIMSVLDFNQIIFIASKGDNGFIT